MTLWLGWVLSDPAPTKRHRYLQGKNRVKILSVIIGVVTTRRRRGDTVVYVAGTAHVVRTRPR